MIEYKGGAGSNAGGGELSGVDVVVGGNGLLGNVGEARLGNLLLSATIFFLGNSFDKCW